MHSHPFASWEGPPEGSGVAGFCDISCTKLAPAGLVPDPPNPTAGQSTSSFTFGSTVSQPAGLSTSSFAQSVTPIDCLASGRLPSELAYQATRPFSSQTPSGNQQGRPMSHVGQDGDIGVVNGRLITMRHLNNY
jgi:hypothetical protein